MLDFIFFDVALRDRFIAALQTRQLDVSIRDDHFGWVAAVAEAQLNEAITTDIEAVYEALQTEQMALIEQAEGGQQKHLASFEVVLPDGQITNVMIPPELAGRLMANFTLAEIHVLFAAVARSALQPDQSAICQTRG